MRSEVKALLIAGAVLVATPALSQTSAGDAPRKLAWKDLLPPAAQKAKPFWLPRRRAADDDSLPSPPTPEGRWLSRRTDQTAVNTGVVAALDGQRVLLGGYVVPLDFDATRVTLFLLVPFVGACIHVPPPPPNQIVLVKASEPFAIQGTFDPVYVTGKIRTSAEKTELADVGYVIEAQSVDVRHRPEAESDDRKDKE
ncbi:MAG: DUF3299 domain-containing protein [Hyphomicrobiaceae bacterium]